ncbi:MAG TPA: response regulator transcription factor [Chitinophagaceae bacterium]|jgi:two-component system, NarL family, invasion response regulator UvrY|nr:response regulator transcription factor [Chitinophagaceae bacterium]
MKPEKIGIVIVDDHQIMRETWRLILEQDPRFSIVAECRSGAEAIKTANDLHFDVMLMDINMHPVNGFEATRKILNKHPSIRIIGMSVNNQPSYARNMLKLGAKGFVTKDSSKHEMIYAITCVHDGDTYICEDVRKKMDDPE